MKAISKEDKGKTLNNIIIGLSIIGMLIGGYFILVPKSSGTASTDGGGGSGSGSDTPSGGGTSTGGGTPSGGGTSTGGGSTVITCAASYSEFPLPFGAGASTRSNYKCEREYVKTVQRYLNLFAANAGYAKLTVDGLFGAKTLDAYQSFFGSQYNQIDFSTYNNIKNDS